MVIKTLGEVALYINGRAFKSTEWEKTGLPIIRIQNLTNKSKGFNRTTQIHEDKYLVENGDLLFAWSASLGAHIWYGEKAWVNQHIFKVVPFQGIDKMYLYYYLTHIVDELYSKTHGSGMVHITQKKFKNTKIPLPKLEDQIKIVNNVESLFSKLDEAKEKVESVLESSENRKAAVLHKAFTGELTKKWREANGEILASSNSSIDPKDLLNKDQEPYEIPDSWNWSTLGKVCGFKGGGTPSKSNPLYWNGDIPWASIKDVKGDELFSTTDFITEEGLNNSSSNLCEKDNLILATRISPGKSIISRIDVAINQDLKIVETELNVEFLHYYFKSIENIFLSKSSGSTVQGINLTNVKNTKIPVPSREEQIVITQKVKTILEKENLNEVLCKDLLGKIELTRKVILSSIFRGTIN